MSVEPVEVNQDLIGFVQLARELQTSFMFDQPHLEISTIESTLSPYFTQSFITEFMEYGVVFIEANEYFQQSGWIPTYMISDDYSYLIPYIDEYADIVQSSDGLEMYLSQTMEKNYEGVSYTGEITITLKQEDNRWKIDSFSEEIVSY